MNHVYVNRFRTENRSKLDLFLRAWLCSDAVSHWMFFRLKLLGVVMVTIVSVSAILQHQFQTIDPGEYFHKGLSYIPKYTHLFIATMG